MAGWFQCMACVHLEVCDLRALGCAGDLVGGDVVELNPQRDTVDGMTAMVAAKLVRELAARISK